jgi:DNA-directed RNA polymerase specialized sigma24 family protein
MARAVRAALELDPCPPLAGLPGPEREAIGLARFVNLDVDEIAEEVGADRDEVKARMLSGLRALAACGAAR